MQPLLIANWKMNPASVRDAKKVFAGIAASVARRKQVQVVVCPPAVYVPELAKDRRGSKVALGMQDLFHTDIGAYTGQLSAPMVATYKVEWAILGHSERRALGETNELVAEKVRYAISAGIAPILCVGESTRTDDGEYYTFIRTQLETVWSLLKRKDIDTLTIAYEPIWAIGKRAEEACSAAQLFEMQLYIRKLLIERYGRRIADAVRILYGGAVKADNAATLVRDGGVHGLLVGSASLSVKEFTGIMDAVVLEPEVSTAGGKKKRAVR